MVKLIILPLKLIAFICNTPLPQHINVTCMYKVSFGKYRKKEEERVSLIESQ